MKYFYHSGSLGDMVYSLPTVRAMGGGVFITGMDIVSHNAIAPLLLRQPYIHGVLHISGSGLPPDFINLSNFRNHPLFTRKHIALLHAETFGVDITGWEKGWLTTTQSHIHPYSIVNVTPRYRDRFFNWDREVRFLFSKVQTVFFLGHVKEYAEFINKSKGNSIRRKVIYKPVPTLEHASYYLNASQYFSSNQSSLLAIRQGLGLPYRFEQSPNHLDTEQGSPHETIINPVTRRIHLVAICAKKAFFDTKTKRL